MNRAKLNYFIDLGLAISFFACAITGIIKFPRLLPYLGIDHRTLPMYELSRLHDWSGLVMTFLVVIHLVLHWNWIVSMTKSFFKKEKSKS